MSSPRLLDHTLRAAPAAGLQVAQLPLWVDVDEPADLGVLDRLEGRAPLRAEPLGGLREVYLHVTHRCGRACRHCYDGAAAADDELTTAEWRDAIDQCAALGASSFVFIGGDPLARDDFVRLVGHITGTHQAKSRFFFNSLIDGDLAGELGRAGPRAAHAAGEHRRAARDQRRPARPGKLRRRPGVGREPAGGRARAGRQHRARAAGAARPHAARARAARRRAPPASPHPAAPARDDLGSADGPGEPAPARGLASASDLVPTGEELLAAVRELLVVAGELGLTVDNLLELATADRQAQRPVRGRLPRRLHRPGRPRARLRHHGRRPGLRGRLAARAAARGDLAHVQQPAAAARGARPRPGRVPRLPGRRRLRRRVLGAGALRGAGARRGRRLRRALPLLRPGAAAARGTRRRGRAAGPAGRRTPAGDCLAVGACGGQSAAGADDYALFDCI